MSLDLFAGLPVVDYAHSVAWYERLLGSPPSFEPGPTEAVWELGEHRYVYVVQLPDRAGHALVTFFVEDLDGLVAEIAGRGIEPERRETYDNGVRKVTFSDPDGNEIGYGGAPPQATS
jgi:catechol 2,3-dioxygenase-like lactoylglutathione lyase family enzyme